jgi:hypothetical protein
MAIVFAAFSFRITAFLYVFTGGSGRFWFSTETARAFTHSIGEAGILVALGVSLVLYAARRPSRYFGNTAPLLMVLALAPLYTTQVVSAPWIWALPFLFTFIGGVFADALETRQRRLYLLLTGAVPETAGSSTGNVLNQRKRLFQSASNALHFEATLLCSTL